MTSLYDATREDIEVLLEDQPAFRITQIWDGLYKQLLEPRENSHASCRTSYPDDRNVADGTQLRDNEHQR